jgi:hypothetical protein
MEMRILEEKQRNYHKKATADAPTKIISGTSYPVLKSMATLIADSIKVLSYSSC